MKGILLRVAIIAFALAFTALTFNFWGDFSRAMNDFLSVAYKDEPEKPPPQQKGVVTMTIVQPTNNKSDCRKDKSHPCPK